MCNIVFHLVGFLHDGQIIANQRYLNYVSSEWFVPGTFTEHYAEPVATYNQMLSES